METKYIILLVIFGYIFLAIISTGLYGCIKASKCAKLIKNRTVPFISNIGFVSCCCGQQGAGKSTMASGITNILSEKLMADAKSKIDNIRRIYFNVDFSIIDSFIKECFDLGFYNTDYVITAIFKAKEDFRDIFGKGHFDDSINYVHNLENFRDYLDSYFAILRNNYAYFLNRQFFSRITNNYAMPLDYSSLSIKDRYIQKDYNLYRYSVLFQDEILLSGGSNLFWQNEGKDDPGVSEYLRLIRHIGKKTMFYIGTAQDFNRIVKSRRELFNNIFEIFNHDIVNTTKVRYWVYESLKSIVNYIYFFIQESLSKKNRIKFIGKYDKLIRRILFKLDMKTKKLESKWYLIYNGIQYSDPDDYLKSIDKCHHPAEYFSLVFPLTYCYGSLNSYEYSSVHDVLSYESKEFKSDYSFKGKPSLASRDDFAKSILKKVKQKKIDDEETNVGEAYIPK